MSRRAAVPPRSAWAGGARRAAARPALGPGYVLTYDMVWVPAPGAALRLPRRSVRRCRGPYRPTPSSPCSTTWCPAMLLQKVASWSAPWSLAGARRRPTGRPLDRGPARRGDAFVWNPFTVERLWIGHWTAAGRLRPCCPGWSLAAAGRTRRPAGSRCRAWACWWRRQPQRQRRPGLGGHAPGHWLDRRRDAGGGRPDARAAASLAGQRAMARRRAAARRPTPPGRGGVGLRAPRRGRPAGTARRAQPRRDLERRGGADLAHDASCRWIIAGAPARGSPALGARRRWRRPDADAGALVALWVLGFGVAVLTWAAARRRSTGSPPTSPAAGCSATATRILALCLPLYAGLPAAARRCSPAAWHAARPGVRASWSPPRARCSRCSSCTTPRGASRAPCDPSTYPAVVGRDPRARADLRDGRPAGAPVDGSYRAPAWNHGRTVLDPLRPLPPARLRRRRPPGRRRPTRAGEDPRVPEVRAALALPTPEARTHALLAARDRRRRASRRDVATAADRPTRRRRVLAAHPGPRSSSGSRVDGDRSPRPARAPGGDGARAGRPYLGAPARRLARRRWRSVVPGSGRSRISDIGPATW